jgi:flagellar basal-body rod protein FlgB
MFDKIFNTSFNVVAKTLNVTHARHKALVSNIANAETPGYRAKDVNFDAELKRQLSNSISSVTMDRTNVGHIGLGKGGNPPIISVDAPSGAAGLDGNTVDLETEMVRLADNTLRYEISTMLMKKKFQGLMNAIKGR